MCGVAGLRGWSNLCRQKPNANAESGGSRTGSESGEVLIVPSKLTAMIYSQKPKTKTIGPISQVNIIYQSIMGRALANEEQKYCLLRDR